MHSNKIIDRKNISELIIELLSTACLVCSILFFCSMSNQYYQTLKDIYAAKAVFMFALYLLFLQRPRILNYQTAIATALYLPIALAYRARYISSPDLFNRDKVVVWIVYFLILILIDMYVYKKANTLQSLNKPMLFVYGFMTLSMIFYRNGRTMPAFLILMFVAYLIPLTATTWKRIFNQVCNAWIISYFYILILSLIQNPAVAPNGRWYGSFVNIGEYGHFLSGVYIIVLYRLYKAIREKKFLSFNFIFYSLVALLLIWNILRVSTVTMYIGIFFSFLMFFILFAGKGTIKAVVIRLVIAVSAIVLCVFLGFFLLKTIALHADKEYWFNVLTEGSVLLKPFANIVTRAFYMFEEPITFSDSNVFPADSLINYLDLFSSGRISIAKVFSERFSFTGGDSSGVDVGTYFAYNAHNTYVQSILEYGYIAGGAHILWLFACTVASVYRFIKERKTANLFLCLWMAMILGVLLGECARFYGPLLFTTLFITYPLIVKIPADRTSAKLKQKKLKKH